MATLVITDAPIIINAVTLSSSANQVTLPIEAEAVEDTAFGDTTKSRIGGLKDWSLDVEFNQDHAAGNVDATLFPIIGTVVTVEVRPTSAVRSATNPGYNGSALLVSYQPFGAPVGGKSVARARFMAAGTLSRSTS